MASRSYDGATIEVLNWEKYNPRGDSKKPSWFRLENSIATGPGFFGLDCEQKWLWIFILSLVSQSNGGEITWNAAYVQSQTGIKPNKQFETIEIFERFARLRVSREVTLRDSHEVVRDSHEVVRDSHEVVRDSPATNERTNDTNERTHAHPRKRESLDFESVYRKYPRKLGKSGGMKIAEREIKTPEELEQLSRAVDRYAEDLRRRGTEEKFIQHFSTFMGSWRDWLDPFAGTASVNKAGVVVAVKSAKEQAEADAWERTMREAEEKLLAEKCV